MLATNAEMNSAESYMTFSEGSGEVFQSHPFLCVCHGCSDDNETIAEYEPAWLDQSSTLSNSAILSGLANVAQDILTGPGNFDYTIDIVDAVGTLTNEAMDAFFDVIDAAMKTWAYYLNGVSGANLEVTVSVGGTSAVASAGPSAMFFGDIIDANNSGSIDDGDFRVVEASSFVELTTGVDMTSGSDLVIFVNEGLLSNNSFFFDPTLSLDVPNGKTDLYSVLLHEIGHGLGFLGINDVPGQFASSNFTLNNGQTVNLNYGTLLDFYTYQDGAGVTRYWGPNAASAYGEGIPIEFGTGSSGSDLSHFLGTRLEGEHSDLRHTLMNPFTVGGDRVEIGNLELLLMQDLGYSIANWTTIFTNVKDGTTIRTVTVGSDVRVNGSTLEFDILLDGTFNNSSVSGSIGFEVQGSNGNWVSGRAIFISGMDTATIELDGEALFGASLAGFDGGIDIRLFNPSNLMLDQQVLSADFVAGEHTPPPPPEPGPTPEPGTITGTNSADTLNGSGDDEIIDGLGGDDALNGKGGDDQLRGGDGADVLSGGGGNDQLNGDAGNDTLNGGNGDDLYTGAGGQDTFNVGFNIDSVTDLNFSAGDELATTFNFSNSSSSKASELKSLGRDGLSSWDNLLTFVNLLQTDDTSNTSAMISGNDLILVFNRSGNGDATNGVRLEGVVGSAGFSADDLSGAGAVSVDTATAAVWDAFDEMFGIVTPPPVVEADITGTSEADVLNGTGSDEIIDGLGGDDLLNGKGGDDELRGGEGADNLTGGGGDDILLGGAGNDILSGSNGDDLYTGSSGQDTFNVGFGIDSVTDLSFGEGDKFATTYNFANAGSDKAADLKSLGKSGVLSAADLLDFVGLLQTDNTSNTSAMISGDDLILVFNRTGGGVANNGVRLEGVVGSDGLSAADLAGAGAVDVDSSTAAVWDAFDDALAV